MKDKENKQTASRENQLTNWAVEAMEPPTGVTSFSALNTRRDGRIQRRNPQFDKESAAMTPFSMESESKRSKSPQKLEKAKDIKEDDKAEPETSSKSRKHLSA